MEKLFPAAEWLGTVRVVEPLLAASLPDTLTWVGTDVPCPAFPLTMTAPALPLGVPLPLWRLTVRFMLTVNVSPGRKVLPGTLNCPLRK